MRASGKKKPMHHREVNRKKNFRKSEYLSNSIE